MIAAIALIVAFQCYWLHKLYKDEYNSLQKEVDVTFRETIYKLQKQRFENDTLLAGHPIKEAFVMDGNKKAGNTFYRTSKDTKTNTTVTVGKVTDIAALRNLDPSKIDCVRVFKAKGEPLAAPPPGLIEVFIKQRIKGDSNLFIKKDSLGKTTITSITYTTQFGDRHLSKQEKDSIISNLPIAQNIVIKLDSSKKKVPGKQYVNENALFEKQPSPIIRFLRTSKSINDSIPVPTLDSAYKTELAKANKKIHYYISLQPGSKDDIAKTDTLKGTGKEFATSKVFVGYNTPYCYQAKFNNIFGFIVQKMGWQISGSFLLLVFVVISFISLYRNLLAQRRLADMKNEFISNITHELKTPIATVNVAIEALRSFGAITSPERTKEYLDISASELQRLSLLVDKVLKLSMFENREIELKKETFDLQQLTNEVLNTMKLQFDKHHATVELKVEGEDFMISADHIHITSVLYNLLDNALKYSNGNPFITVELKKLPQQIELHIADKGIGIPAAYTNKVFEKFFRVPTGNKHNVKGYGLGLSYVYHVMEKHNGSIQVKSEEGIGSVFTVKFPIA